MRQFLFILWYIIGISSLFGQGETKLYAKEIGTKNGLPSSTVYYLMEDSKGFVWIGTDKGVAKYNGYDFEYFNTGNGLTNNNIFTIKEDQETGFIWFNAFHGGMCYYDGDTIQPHPLNDEIKRICAESWVYTFSIDSTRNFWFTSTNRDYRDTVINYNFYKIPPSNDTIIIVDPNSIASVFLSKETYFKKIEGHIGRDVISSGTVGFFGFDTSFAVKKMLKFEDNFLQNGIRKVIQLEDGKILGNNHEELVIFDEQKIHYFDNTYWKYKMIYQASEIGGVLFLGTDKGVKILDENYQIKGTFLENYPISHVLKDRDGNYWFSSLNNGVFVASNLELKQYFLDEVISRIEIGVDSSVWVSTKDGVLYKFLYDSELNSFDYKLMASSTGFDLINEPIDSFRLSSQMNVKIKRDSMIVCFLRIPKSIKTLKWGNNSKLMVGYSYGFGIYSDLREENIFHSSDIGFTQWVKSMLQDSKGQYWIGTAKGLYLFTSLQVPPIYIGDISDQLKNSILEIVEIEKGKILVATDGNGLVMIENEKVTNLPINEQLSSNFINCIFVENDSSVWIGTNLGINHLKGNIESPKIEYYNTRNGFPVNDIRIIKKVKNHLFVGSNKGMVVYNKQPNFKISPYKTYLHHLEVNNQYVAPKLNYKFNNDENNLVFHFRTIRFNRLHEYYYRLKGIDDTWKKVSINKVQYNELPHGNYVFQVKAENSSPLSVRFFIQPHFTQTWWFFILFSLGILGIGVFVTILFFKRQNRKMLEERRMSDLESKALRSQMNPHFIFNAMNSIMFLIVNNNPKAARKYLSQFSKLMRFVLENSKHNFISLESEVETLRSYLELEKLRYGEHINIHIEISEDIDLRTSKIPPMLIQPILENALMHGLAPKSEAGNLWLTFSTHSKGFYVIIKDNGIGRVAAQKFTGETSFLNKTSTAIKNIEDRIENINIIYQTALEFQLEDLYENKQATGTKVVFFIPHI